MINLVKYCAKKDKKYCHLYEHGGIICAVTEKVAREKYTLERRT